MRNRIDIRKWGLLYLVLWSLSSCYQSDPQPPSVNTSEFGRVGDSIRFSGYDWTVKTYENQQWGPGPNYFSGDERDITIDKNGFLHLKIVNRDGKWMSTEVICDEAMGYGKYSWTVEGTMDSYAPNTVVGLFTWDDHTFDSDANSEVDIEFSKWGNPSRNTALQYGVQPINFGTLNPERDYRPVYDIGAIEDVSTHNFLWTDTAIIWKSYIGDIEDEAKLIGEWRFGLENPGRVKEEGGNVSKPVVIPAPGANTNARMNFWLLTAIHPEPTDGLKQEFIVRKFSYDPI